MFAVISYTLFQTETEGALTALLDARIVLMMGQMEILSASNVLKPRDTTTLETFAVIQILASSPQNIMSASTVSKLLMGVQSVR